jgi:hypothetical protein
VNRACCFAAVVATVIAAGCVTNPDGGVHEYLDEQSAATVNVASHGLVFARERPDLAVHARDYLTLVPIDVNRSGTHVQYFYCYVWSTIDKRGLPADDRAPTQFELIADGRRIPLTPVAAAPKTLGLAASPLPAPSDSAQLLITTTNRETLSFLLDAAEVRAVAVRDGLRERYELWSDGRSRGAGLDVSTFGTSQARR